MAEQVISIAAILVMFASSAAHVWGKRYELAFAWFLAFFYAVVAYGELHG